MNNPPAFPHTVEYKGSDCGGIVPHGGMTLRDYFAAKAMQGYISAKAWHPDFVFPTDFNFEEGKRAADAVAVSAYKWADAMLKAREA